MRAGTFGFLMYVFSAGAKLSTKPGKCQPPTADEIEFLGYVVRLRSMELAMSAERIALFARKLTQILQRDWPWLTKQNFRA
eukprot:SAG11_NODE_661_length_7885_cov_8.956974_3_plen_81_part_00